MQSIGSQVNKRFIFLLEKIHEKGLFRNKTLLTNAIGLDSGQLSRTKHGKRKLEYLTLASLKSNVPTVNMNWLFSGTGSPFLDDDFAIPEDYNKLKDEVRSLRSEIDGLRKLMGRMELKEEIDIDKLSVEEKAAYMLVLLKEVNK